MKTSKQFTQKVKEVLDNSSFNYQYCGHHGCDADKAEAYLNTQRFSIKVIETALNEQCETILECAREQKVYHEDLPTFAAHFIAHDLCFDRIRRFLYNERKHAPGHGWSVDESVSWHIA